MANEAHKIKLLVLWDILCKNTDPYLRLYELRSNYHAEYGRAIRAGFFLYRISVRAVSTVYVVGAFGNRRRMEYRDGRILCDCTEERGKRKGEKND